MFPISRSQKRRHTLVQPEMGPITVGHHIPPPLMGEFVRAQPVVALVRQYAPPVSLIQSAKAAHLLFYAACRQHLCISSICVRNACHPLKKTEHVRCVTENSDQLFI